MTISELITQDAIAGHEIAINKLIESIGDRITDHRLGNAVLDMQINQDLAAIRILVKEWKEMRAS